jgi:hypothetical protein
MTDRDFFVSDLVASAFPDAGKAFFLAHLSRERAKKRAGFPPPFLGA